ncbi:MAG: EVE domain-containing protein [Alphaproteobacteria bacterium]|nr:EVE domain-containing protein [Alphaproteobacteria bacterium]
MAHWLVKSEPSVWSFEQQIAAGAKGTHWNGVRNHLAKQHLMAMKKGDHAFFYHSNEGKEIVGIVEVIKTFYPDPTDESGKFGMVDFKAVKALQRPVTLAEVKATPALAKMSLVTSMRLSVQPVTEAEWKLILKMSGTKE